MGSPLMKTNSFLGAEYRNDFPIFRNQEKPVAFLDSAASAQKPNAVIDAMHDVMQNHYANIHRGLYGFSQKTTEAYENARRKVASFLNAQSDNEIVFTRNTTESINLVAQSWAVNHLSEGDEILITELEHHANIVPWHMVCERYNAKLVIVPVEDNGQIDASVFKSYLTDRTKFVSMTQMSNAIGVINDVETLIPLIRQHNKDIKILIDGSQSAVHKPIDVQDISCDFFVFTGHKLYGPSGIGVLWGREDLLNELAPYQGGGDMIETVSFKTGITYKPAPAKFEAGTPAIVEAIGLGAAIDYVSAIGVESIDHHERALYHYMREGLEAIDGLFIYGDVDAHQKAPLVSFKAEWAHSSDIATILDQCNVSVRSGHHCAMPLMERFGVDGTIRASLGLYNTHDDVDQFIEAMHKAYKFLG